MCAPTHVDEADVPYFPATLALVHNSESELPEIQSNQSDSEACFAVRDEGYALCYSDLDSYLLMTSPAPDAHPREELDMDDIFRYNPWM